MSDVEKRLTAERVAVAEKPASAKPASAKPPAGAPASKPAAATTTPKQRGFLEVEFTENTVIFEEGDPGDAAYLIVQGHVEIRKGMRTSNPQTLADLNHGDVFGEMALFDDRPRMAEAIARSPVKVIAIRREEFDRRLETVDPVMRSITRYLVKRVRNMADEFIKRKDPGWGQWKQD